MAEQQMGTYFVDIVMCIDATAAMRPIIDEIRQNSPTLYSRIIECSDEAYPHIDQLRIKVIVFRDYYVDNEPMAISDFFVLPDEYAEFEAYLNTIETMGGGDAPESALEALSLAMKSDWTTEGYRQRHVIVLFTDAPAHPLGKFKDVPSYPSGIPENFEQLKEWWEGEPCDIPLDSTYKPSAGRLIIFAPDAEPWPDFATFDRCWLVESKASEGCSEINFDTIINLLAYATMC